jgi:hypothetical protein
MTKTTKRNHMRRQLITKSIPENVVFDRLETIPQINIQLSEILTILRGREDDRNDTGLVGAMEGMKAYTHRTRFEARLLWATFVTFVITATAWALEHLRNSK